MTNRFLAMLKFFARLFKKQGDDTPFSQFDLGPQCDIIPNAQGEFGYDQSNPIPVCLPNGQTEYLGGLRCECGEPFDFQRMGNYGPGQDGHVVDGFELVCKTKKHQITLYMDMYHWGPSSLVPEKLRKADG